MSRAHELIVKGLNKRQELERKLEKDKTIGEKEVEVLNDYWKAIKSFSNPEFVLNMPVLLPFEISNGYGTAYLSSSKHFIGEEKFAYKEAYLSDHLKVLFIKLYLKDPTDNSVTSDYVVVSGVTAMRNFDGFDAFYKAAFDYHNDKLIKQTRKEANELEEKAHKAALRHIVDDPLFGSW